MRWSQAYIPTLRDDPANAEAASHRLLQRAGYIRQLSAGHYSMLPLGQRVRRKIDRIIRQEIDGIGGQQFHLPAMHPAELWKKSGRWDIMGDEMFRLIDRKGSDNALGMTHEEVFAELASEISSYKQLPQLWYQIQTKFRDEPRPKSGVLRVREFTMKDSYSLDLTWEGLDNQFDRHHGAYQRIFGRFGLEAVDVEASSGAMGGSDSVEFMVRSDAGEDWIVTCATCDYRANLERATSQVPDVSDPASVPEPEQFATPEIRTIAALAEAFPDIAAPDRQIKTLVYMLDGTFTLVLMRGDHALQEQKLQDVTGAVDVRPAQADEIRQRLGALPGSLGAAGVTAHPIIADEALKADLREVQEGERCVVDGGTLDLWKGIEVGHIFKLGTKYSEAMGAIVQDEHGESKPIIMGSYGIGLERSMAAVVEASHDDAGIIWPWEVTPYHVVITLLRQQDESVVAAGDRLYEQLTAAGY